MLDLSKKYNLPSKVKVLVTKTSEGSYMATFPELPGCLTEADDVVDLLYQVNDAVFTYFDILRKDLKDIDFLYTPPRNFLKNIEKVKPKPQVRRSVEFHIPYAFA
jgi:predicted RNase H-like HicB family nuclease